MKNILQYLIVFSSLMFFSCQTEELVVEKTSSNYLKKRITFDEFKKQTGITSLQSLITIPPNANDILAKTSDGRYEINDFEIQTKQIIQLINSNNKTTYSFNLKPKNEVLLAKENYNLVYHKESGLWGQTIVYFEDRLELNKTVYENISTVCQSTSPSVVINPNPSIYAHGGCSNTISFVECDGSCAANGNSTCDGFNCPTMQCVTTVMIISSCVPGGSEGSTNHGDDSADNTGSTQGGDGFSFSPNIDLPLFGAAADNPCKNMKDLVQPNLDKPSIKPEIDWLKTKIDENHEFGVEVEKNKDPQTNEWLDCTYTQKESQNANVLTISLSTGGKIIGSAHSHPFGISYAIPSYGDLKWLLDCYDRAASTRKEFVFTMIICKDNNGINHVYSLNINNIISFRTKVMGIWNDTKYDGLDENLKINKIHQEQGINLKNSNGQLEKSFLEQFKNFGFDLLEATNDNLDEWKKVEISPTATIIKVPCN